MPRRKRSKGRLVGGNEEGEEGGYGADTDVDNTGFGPDCDDVVEGEDGGRGHGVDFGTKTARYAIPLPLEPVEMEPIDIDPLIDLGDGFLVPRPWDSSKLSQVQIDLVRKLIEGQNLGVRHGTWVPYAPPESNEKLPVEVPSLCLVVNKHKEMVAMWILLKVKMIPRSTKNKPGEKSLQAFFLPAGDLPAGEVAAGEPLFEWKFEKLLKKHTPTMWYADVCERCFQFVPAMLDQHAFQADLLKMVKVLCQGLGIRPNNPHPGPPLKKKPKTLEEAEELKQIASNERAARRDRFSELHDLERKKHEEQIKKANEQNTKLREARHAAEAVAAASAAATAGPGFRGPGPPGQSSQGKGPAAAAAGEGDLPPQDQALLAQLRIYCKDPEKREVCDLARFILGSGKGKRGKQRAKERQSSGDESSAQETDEEGGQGSSANILPVGSKRRRKAPPQPLTMNNLVMSLNALGSCSVLNKLNKKKSEANGTNSKAQKKESEGGPFSITFKNSAGRYFRKLHLVSGKAPWDHILPEQVHSVNCFHKDIKDLNIDVDVENYRTKVAELPKDHHLVKVLQKNNIEIPEKEQTATLGDHEV
jgi:hypothetical protein